MALSTDLLNFWTDLTKTELHILLPKYNCMYDCRVNYDFMSVLLWIFYLLGYFLCLPFNQFTHLLCHPYAHLSICS